MNYRILLQKVYVAVVLLVLLAIQVAVPVANATTTIDGSLRSYGFNNQTAVSGVVITNAGGLIGSGVDDAALTRLDEFVITFDIFDLDGFDHLDVYIALFNTNSSSAETTSGALINAINSGVRDQGFVVRWLAPERSVYLSGLTSGLAESFVFDITSGVGVSNFFVKSGVEPIDPETYNSGIADFVTPENFNLNAPGTWEITSGVAPTAVVSQSGIVNNFTDGTSGVRNIMYTVSIPFTMSKVAPSSGVWNLGVMVHDRLQKEIDEERNDQLKDIYVYTVEYYKNQWYGEVEIVGNSGITFIDVEAGSGFQLADQAGEAGGIQVRFTSNGTYNQQVQADTTWNPDETTPTRVAFAYLSFNSGLSTPTTPDQNLLDTEGNRFAIQVRRIKLGSDAVVLSEEDWVNINPINPNDALVATNFIIPSTNTAVYRTSTNQVPNNDLVDSYISSISNAPGTTEVGVISIFEFQLRLSSVFQNKTYTGNISIGVSNESNTFFPPSP